MEKSVLHLFADVGGTFSDCLFWLPPPPNTPGRGTFSVKKLLSTGVIPVQCTVDTNRQHLIVNGLTWKSHHAFVGYTMKIHGIDSFETIITDTMENPDRFVLQHPLPHSTDSDLTAEVFSNEPPVIVALRAFLGLTLTDPLPDVVIRYATTIGTNALLERKGSATALVTTTGFEDILRIGYQERPELFNLNIHQSIPLVKTSLGLNQRTSAFGHVQQPLDETDAKQKLQHLKHSGIESIAICFLNSWVNPDHEMKAAQLATEAGFKHVFISQDSSPLIKMIPRADTTVADAYLTPILTRHLMDIESKLSPESEFRVMTSAGGMQFSHLFSGRQSVLSGPAGGIVALSTLHRQTSFTALIGFDMGGTSTDVSRFDGRFEYRYNTELAGIRLSTPALNIETVAAGGGSLCHFDGNRLMVGPDSAGASPGPAAYGNNGPLTLTDVNVFLGYLPRFPFPLDHQVVMERLEDIARKIETSTGNTISLPELARGFRQIACETMATSIRKISLSKGYDIRNHALCCFGGAGPQHACQMAELLGIKTVLVHPLASVLSAYGLSNAPVKVIQEKPILDVYRKRTLNEWSSVINELKTNALAHIVQSGIDPDQCHIRKMVDMRYLGQSHALTIDFDDISEIDDLFRSAHHQFYGHTFDGRGMEVVAFRLEVSGLIDAPQLPVFKAAASPVKPRQFRQAIISGQSCDVPVYYREDLQPGHTFDGPAIVSGPDTSILVEPHWKAEVDTNLMVVLTSYTHQPNSTPKANHSTRSTHANHSTEQLPAAPDPVLTEVLHHRFASIAEEMGVILQKSAVSTNIRERLDFSCAVFSAQGHLTANAPHIPVHLGAMSETIAVIQRTFPDFQPGDVFVTNDPYKGGSHLPDITVIMPVFDPTDQHCFYTAVRAHHAEIGGITPGSMPPHATNLAQEGIVIPPFKLGTGNRLQLDSLREILSSGPHPSRTPEDNVSDILAQVAACRRGAELLMNMINEYGPTLLNHTITAIRETTARSMENAIKLLPEGEFHFTDHLDDGSPVSANITLKNGKAVVDFTGTGQVLANNLNANPAIVRSAVMFCFRCLIENDIPLNQGVMDPITLIIPESLLNPPWDPDPANRAAVSGGNVETSQRICDAVFGALGIIGASQGTMNNVIIGNSTMSYYETIGGGSGAGQDFGGTDGVQVHMTNTRITDPEVLERRYKIELVSFSIRRHSGGIGKYNGGDGLIREYRFTEPVQVTIVSERRGHFVPYGANGGLPGCIGKNTLFETDGSATVLPGKVSVNLQAGQRLRIETPGGGGYGEPV